jgi:hypothetical protein
VRNVNFFPGHYGSQVPFARPLISPLSGGEWPTTGQAACLISTPTVVGEGRGGEGKEQAPMPVWYSDDNDKNPSCYPEMNPCDLTVASHFSNGSPEYNMLFL